MLVFKLFTLNNVLFYFTYFIMIIFILFLSYKYLYLEQSIYLMSNKLNKLEIELNNPTVCKNINKVNANIKNADIIMNEIFNPVNTTNSNSNPISSTKPISSIKPILNQIPAEEIIPVKEDNISDGEEIVNEIFDLKKDITFDDKESSTSNIMGGGHNMKKTLMKLSIDKLKTKCEERKLSTDGTKNQLADRIIVHDNIVEIEDT